jgi:hypothetical protein
MAGKLNKKSLEHAKNLIRDGRVHRDERDDWSEHAPSAEQENKFIDKHGFDEFASWHLGLDREASKGTKGSVTFPFGDFTKVHRCAVISLESRAAQYGHDDIAKAAKDLLKRIDAE